jgi:tetratricopeptide (TPR) repeat protein
MAEGAKLGDDGLLEWLLRSHRERASGSLTFDVGGRARRLLLRDGELYLPRESPLAVAVDALGAAADGARWEPLLGRLVAAYLDAGLVSSIGWHAGDAASPDAAGPLPTEALLRRAFAASAKYAPPPTSPLVAAGGDRDFAGAPVCPTHEERWILERLRRPMAYGELAADCPFPESRLRTALAGLAAVGRVHDPQRAPLAPQDSGLLRLVELLAARIGATLRERPLGLLDDAHRRRLETLTTRVEGASHYELLGVAADAGDAAIQAAFEELGRLAHPLHAERPALGVPRASLTRLFERAVAAYRTLGDPALRAAYDSEHGVVRSAGEPASEQGRREEIAALARREFERARFEERNGDFQAALSLYEQVAEIDPRPEYLLALARLEARNPAWTARALATVARALERSPESAEARYLAGELYERAGEPERAAGYYQAVATRHPEHDGARRALRRLAERGVGRDPRRSGAFDKLFRRG